MHRREDAAREMKKVAPAGGDVETDLTEIATALSQEPTGGSWSDVFRSVALPAHGRVGTCNPPAGNGHQRHHLLRRPDFRRGLLRHEASRTTVTTWAIGGVNAFSNLIAIAFIDRLGRRKLLLAGLIGMAVSLIGGGGAFQFIAAHGLAAAAATSSSCPSGAELLTLLGLVAFIIPVRVFARAGGLDRD